MSLPDRLFSQGLALGMRERLSAVGTRAVWRDGPGDYRVRCATCDGGGSVLHKSREAASRAAARDSGTACRACGAS